MITMTRNWMSETEGNTVSKIWQRGHWNAGNHHYYNVVVFKWWCPFVMHGICRCKIITLSHRKSRCRHCYGCAFWMLMNLSHAKTPFIVWIFQTCQAKNTNILAAVCVCARFVCWIRWMPKKILNHCGFLIFGFIRFGLFTKSFFNSIWKARACTVCTAHTPHPLATLLSFIQLLSKQ